MKMLLCHMVNSDFEVDLILTSAHRQPTLWE